MRDMIDYFVNQTVFILTILVLAVLFTVAAGWFWDATVYMIWLATHLI